MRRLFNKKTVITILALAMAASFGLSGCGKNNEATEEATTAEPAKTYSIDLTPSVAMISPTKDNVSIVKDGMIRSKLTGEWIDESFENKRPIAIMINNIDVAMPQSGISNADIIYEMLVEGGITRLMAVFQDYSGLDKLGPVRSARHYYDRKAIEFDAIYIHYGHSIYAGADFDDYASQLDHIEGLYTSGHEFYRDNSRNAPHNCYTSTDGINEGIENKGFETDKYHGKDDMFSFKVTASEIGGTQCNKMVTAYNSGRKPWFEYDADSKTYKRFQYGKEQIDDQTGEQLEFTNVIVQFCRHDDLDGGLIHIEWCGEGEGYYCSYGQVIPIIWRKTSDLSVTHYYNIDGTELQLNPGKTWISVMSESKKDGVTIE